MNSRVRSVQFIFEGDTCPLLGFLLPIRGEVRSLVQGDLSGEALQGLDPKTGKRIQHRKAGFRTEREARIERNKVAVKSLCAAYQEDCG